MLTAAAGMPATTTRLACRSPRRRSASGACYDNALMESFWATLKTELVEEQPFASHAAARCNILLYIEGFYNLRRRHSALGYLSPVEFERRRLGALGALKAVGA